MQVFTLCVLNKEANKQVLSSFYKEMSLVPEAVLHDRHALRLPRSHSFLFNVYRCNQYHVTCKLVVL